MIGKSISCRLYAGSVSVLSPNPGGPQRALRGPGEALRAAAVPVDDSSPAGSELYGYLLVPGGHGPNRGGAADSVESHFRELGSRPGGGLAILMRWRRILRTSEGSVMTAMSFISDPQRGHINGSTSYTFAINTTLWNAMDFIAALTQFIPPWGVRCIHYYGLYSSRCKARWQRLPHVARLAPEIEDNALYYRDMEDIIPERGRGRIKHRYLGSFSTQARKENLCFST